ncbi:hypothetical protein A2400_02320 [candidate division WS6 bacterium RIFOXYB1_FULL_33_14]|uniref:Thioredoxin domain-containing protein n=1 Tax=candidate division WS6 bacterium RIFOXYB1_FULL_33_14 TaxID=1817896 RepID=A0A1F4UJ17_9BACT|nr:MAG: hypothetical protein A2400_02320 [candidate division WS6 bacterium RIFOXYB1_FULL_33_14]
MPKSKDEKIKKNEEIVIDLDSIAVPGAIILAGIIIAGAIFFTNKGNTPAVDGTDDAANPTANQEEFPVAETTISDSPYLGDIKKAKVAIVEYTDYQCPYCGRHASETKPSIIKDYVDTGKVIYVVRNFPLDFHGQIAIDTANAALCVDELSGASKFFEFYAKAFSQTDTDALKAIAKDLGVNMSKYDTCMSENRYKDAIDADMADGSKAGVQGTPGFVIGVLDKDGNVKGKLIAGAYPYESFQSILEEYLK